MIIKDVLSVSNLSKCYNIYAKPQDRLKEMFLKNNKYSKEFWALKNVDFKVKQGETVGIIGRNGSGKSTLLQLIVGTLMPTTGSIKIEGRVVALLELGSGFNPEFTGEENVYLSGSILGISKAEMDKKFEQIAQFADIGDFLYRPVKTYSSGMHARLAFAVAIHTDPDVLIVDEILAVGDAAFQAKCNRAFHRIREQGCTVLLVTQDPYMVRTFCTSALYLRKGEMVAYGNPTDVTEKYLLELEKAQLDEKSDERKQSQSISEDTNTVTQDSQPESGPLFRIEQVNLLDLSNNQLLNVKSGQSIKLQFKYRSLTSVNENVVFVFSLYRHDGLYICGNTTLMDHHEPFSSKETGVVEVIFPNFKLLSGNYKWRVAIDDDRGLGIYVEAYSEIFNVVDELEAVGLFNLDRKWVVE